MKEIVKRINELSKISKCRKLTIDEEEERAKLRKIYIDGFKKNFKSQMDNVYVKELDGSVTKLTGE